MKTKLILKINNDKKIIRLTEHLANLVTVSGGMRTSLFSHYDTIGLRYADVPLIVGITGACENVDTLFRVNNRSNVPLFFTQTGQLSLEQALQSFHGLYTVIHSGRDEEKEDDRHLRQFLLTEEEFDSTLAGMNRSNFNENRMFEAMLTHIEKAVQSMIGGAVSAGSRVLTKSYGRNLKHLLSAAKHHFPRITYEEAVKLLNANGFDALRFGDDLGAAEEAKIAALLQTNGSESPVFIMKYPKEIKFFNMKVSGKDPRVVLSADLIFPYAGEGTGAAVREPDYEKLKERLINSRMYKLHLSRGGKLDDFAWYLEIIKNQSTLPHAGYGIGNERVLQYIFGLTDIRGVSLFSLLSRQTHDWDESKKIEAYSLFSHKKAILLTIGKVSNKQKLLPYVKDLADSHLLLCATKKTHLFLKKHGIMTTLVYKISEEGEKPNLADLLSEKLFDIIINIPTGKVRKGPEFTDGAQIRKMAVEGGATLITDLGVAKMLLTNLAKNIAHA